MATAMTRSDVSVLIPVEISREIIKAAERDSVALRMGSRRTMSRKEMRIPVMSVLPSTYWVNGEGDTAKKGTTMLSLTGPTIVVEELAVIIRIPETVLDDSGFDVWGEARPALQSAFGAKIDEAIFFGIDAPSTFPQGGLLQACIDKGNTFTAGSGGPDFAGDVSGTMELVEDDGYDTNGFVASSRVKAVLRNLRATDNQPIFSPALTQGEGSLLWGERLTYVRGLPETRQLVDLFTGDWSMLLVAIREDISYKILDQAVVEGISLAETDQVALRAVMRIGWTVVNPVTRDNPEEASRFPFAALLPAGTNGGGSTEPEERRRQAQAQQATSTRGGTSRTA